MFDQYSLLHAATGVIAYFWNIELRTFVLLHILFELFENTNFGIRMINSFPLWPGGKAGPDSFSNSMIGDNISAIAGFLLAKKLDKHVSKANPC